MHKESKPEETYYRKSVKEVLKLLNSSENGLSKKEASNRLKQTGLNKLKSTEKRSVFQIFISQLKNPVIYLLLGAAVISFIFQDYPEAIAIIVVIVLNTIIGFWMEYQASSSMETLKKIDKLYCSVIRDGQQSKLEAENLVPGDIVLLEAGNVVPADGRIFDESEFSVDESPMTGESVPVKKSVDQINAEKQVADQHNMVFKGTAVTNGKARIIVTTTGMQTEIGKISKMVRAAEKDKIPLNQKLSDLSKKLIWFTAGLAVLFFAVGWLAGKEVYLLLQTAIAWTVAAIPEGLPIVASIALARGMLRLAKQNVIVKQLASVETLGETTVIFTDKTGTLTENKLTTSKFLVPDGQVDITKKTEDNSDQFLDEQENYRHIYNVSVLCNDAKTGETPSGDPLEQALLYSAKSISGKAFDDLKQLSRVHEDPFDSESKIMGTVHVKDQKLYISGKGAIMPILDRCSMILQHGKILEFDESKKESWSRKNDELSAEGFRVLGIAFKESDQVDEEKIKKQDDFVRDMIFLGLIAFVDPPREEVAESIKICHKAGINVVMVTGDHPETALSIAKKLHIAAKDQHPVIHGDELNMKLKDEKAAEEILESKIFARVDPEQKLSIVAHFQRNGQITAMTGDGVNDAPALKKADIGISMGKRGTQVAQDVADMILKNDSFSSIVKAIEQGRIIFGNIRKFIMYQLSYHFSEIIIIAAISFSLFYLPLLPLQLLFLNLLSDVFPALALGVGKGSVSVMNFPPKNPDEPVITKKNWITMLVFGVIIAAYIIGVYLLAYFLFDYSKEVCNNMAFFSLAFAQLLHVFNMREDDESVLVNQVTKNKFVWFAIVFCVAALLTAYFIPVLRNVLEIVSLDSIQWTIIAIGAVLPLLTIQGIKMIFKI